MKMTLITIFLPATMLLIGCRNESERVSRIAEQSMRQQADQNTEMARLNREIAEATERLISADAAARQEILDAHQSLVEQRDALELERRQLASERINESILAPILWHLGTLLLCLLPVALAILVLRPHEPDDSNAVNEMLIQELVSEHPKLLPPKSSLKRIAVEEDTPSPDAAV